jgi:hypothetical protein
MPTPVLEKLAALEVMMAEARQDIARVIRHLEGNGTPGLLERVPLLERMVLENHQSTTGRLSRIEASLERAADIQAGTQKQLEALAAGVQRHQDPDNLQHRTLAHLLANDPKAFLRGAGVLVVALVILNSSGVLRTLGEWLAGMR